jgi:two-component system response regulator YesN
MNHAADCILEKRLQIQEVAMSMGFEDPQHFSRTFKKVIGISPTDLIRQSLR